MENNQAYSPAAPVEMDREMEALLAVHANDRAAHFGVDVPRLLAHAGEEFIYVSNGVIERATRDELAQTFTESFRGATYFAWDDREPPIARISADATMAWMIVRTTVRRTQPDAEGGTRERAFIYAGIMTYEKREGRWLRVANVSTFAEPD